MHINIVVLIELSEFYAYLHNYIHITLLFLDRLSEESIRGLISYAHLERIPSQIDKKSGYEVCSMTSLLKNTDAEPRENRILIKKIERVGSPCI